MAKYVKPTKTTKFHIDFNWWEQTGRSLRSYLLEHLCDDYRDLTESDSEPKMIDWVDPNTGQTHFFNLPVRKAAHKQFEALRRLPLSVTDRLIARVPWPPSHGLKLDEAFL